MVSQQFQNLVLHSEASVVDRSPDSVGSGTFDLLRSDPKYNLFDLICTVYVVGLIGGAVFLLLFTLKIVT
jgi:hypothetical protein